MWGGMFASSAVQSRLTLCLHLLELRNMISYTIKHNKLQFQWHRQKQFHTGDACLLFGAPLGSWGHSFVCWADQDQNQAMFPPSKHPMWDSNPHHCALSHVALPLR